MGSECRLGDDRNPGPAPADLAIRDAASVILVRDAATRPRVLMGQRGAGAAFMPDKFVFPGGAVDPGDAAAPLAGPLDELCAARLAEGAGGLRAETIAAAAIRELWEEAGLLLGVPGLWPGRPAPGWEGFAATGHLPSSCGLAFVFRAITPPGRPRRFDARFLLADARHLAGDPDDFSRASDELGALQWIPLDTVRRFDLPFITQVVLAEVAARLPDFSPPPAVPFFHDDDEASLLLRLGRRGDPG